MVKYQQMVLATKPKRPTTIQHRKRTGSHHKRTKAYHKSYWPYLPMLAIVLAGVLVNMVWAPHSGGVLAYATNVSINGLLAETNSERLTAGQSGLVINQKLMAAAQAKANDMASRNYWSHITPEGQQPWWFVTNAGYDYQATGENLAYGFDNSDATVTGWMNSPSHKANLLNAAYQDVGFGIANAADYQGVGQQTVVVAMYGKVLGTTTAAAVTPPAPAAAPSNITAPQPVPAPAPTTATNPNPPAQSEPSTNPATVPPATPTVPPITTTVPTSITSQPVSRLELMAADVSPVSVFVTILIIAVAGAVFILRHIYFWHRTLVRGEAFVIKHWKADLVIVAIIVAGTLVTRTTGFIQ